MLERRSTPSLTERHGVRILEDWFMRGEYLNCLETAALLLEVDPNSAELESYFLRSAERLGYDGRVQRAMELCFYGRDPLELPEAFYAVREHLSRHAH